MSARICTNIPDCGKEVTDPGVMICPHCNHPLPEEDPVTSSIPDPVADPPDAFTAPANPGSGDPSTGIMPDFLRPDIDPNGWVLHLIRNNNVDAPIGLFAFQLPRGRLLDGEPAKIGRQGARAYAPDINLHPLDHDRAAGNFRASRDLGMIYYRDGHLWLVRWGSSKIWRAGASWPADEPAEPIPKSGKTGNRNPVRINNGDELTFGSNPKDTFTLKLSMNRKASS